MEISSAGKHAQYNWENKLRICCLRFAAPFFIELATSAYTIGDVEVYCKDGDASSAVIVGRLHVVENLGTLGANGMKAGILATELKIFTGEEYPRTLQVNGADRVPFIL